MTSCYAVFNVFGRQQPLAGRDGREDLLTTTRFLAHNMRAGRIVAGAILADFAFQLNDLGDHALFVSRNKNCSIIGHTHDAYNIYRHINARQIKLGRASVLHCETFPETMVVVEVLWI